MTEQEGASPATDRAPGTGFKAWFLLLLVLLSVSTVMSRHIINVLVQPIKADLQFTDTQISVIKDIALTIPYVLFAFPIARIADNWSRPKLIAISAAIWSGAAALCGSAGGFLAFLLGRGGIGLGEAVFTMPQQAMLADVFPARQRGTAMSIFLLGATIGTALNPVFGGWASHAHGWRWTYIAVAIPGLVLAPIVWFLLKDVPRGISDGIKVDDGKAKAPFAETAKMLLSIPSLPKLILAAGFNAFLSMGIVSWLFAFMERSHGMTMDKAGPLLGGALFFGPLIGHSVGGPLIDWLSRRDERWYLWLPALCGAGSAIIGYLMLTGPTNMVYPMLLLLFVVSGTSAAPMMASVAALSPPHARATATALLMITINLVGFAAGPFLVARLSDMLHASYGDASLQVGMLWSLLAAVPSTLLCLWGARSFRADRAAIQARYGVSPAPSH